VSPLDLRTSRNLDKFKAMAPFNGPTYNNAWVPPSKNKPTVKV